MSGLHCGAFLLPLPDDQQARRGNPPLTLPTRNHLQNKPGAAAARHWERPKCFCRLTGEQSRGKVQETLAGSPRLCLGSPRPLLKVYCLNSSRLGSSAGAGGQRAGGAAFASRRGWKCSSSKALHEETSRGESNRLSATVQTSWRCLRWPVPGWHSSEEQED